VISMSISDNYLPTKTLGNGATLIFSFSWDGISSEYVKVFFQNVSTGVITEQTTGFTKALNAGSAGGTVTFLVAPTSSNYVIIARETPKSQTDPYTTSSGFQASVIENNFDKLVAMIQEDADKLIRSFGYPLGTDVVSLGYSTDIPTPEAGKILGWDDGGTYLENKLGLEESVAASEAAQAAAEAAQAAAESAESNADNSAGNADTARIAAEAAQAAAEAAAGSFTLASQAEAEAGSDNVKYLSSLRVAQAITAQAVKPTATQTLTNKEVVQRVITTTDDATAVIDVAVTDVYQLSAVANATAFSFTGTPKDGQKFIIRFKDAGVSKALTWTGITPIGVTLPAATTAGKWTYVGIIYNSAAAQYHAVSVVTEA
jgi:hypothetical protein